MQADGTEGPFGFRFGAQTLSLTNEHRGQSAEHEYPTIEAQRRELRKKRLLGAHTTPLHMRVLRSVQSYFTYVLIRTKVSAR